MTYHCREFNVSVSIVIAPSDIHAFWIKKTDSWKELFELLGDFK